MLHSDEHVVVSQPVYEVSEESKDDSVTSIFIIHSSADYCPGTTGSMKMRSVTKQGTFTATDAVISGF